MSMTNSDSLATKKDLHEMYDRIYPYLGGGESGGGGGHTIEDSTGTALTQRDVMQFSDSFSPTDDSTNEVTKIELNKLTSGEMDDIVTPLPSVQARYHKYSTDEHIVGEWIDGSYIYEITKDNLNYTPPSTIQWNTITTAPSNANNLINCIGIRNEGVYHEVISGLIYQIYDGNIKCLPLLSNADYRKITTLVIQYTKSSS